MVWKVQFVWKWLVANGWRYLCCLQRLRWDTSMLTWIMYLHVVAIMSTCECLLWSIVILMHSTAAEAICHGNEYEFSMNWRCLNMHSIYIYRLHAHINQHESIIWNQESTCHLVLSDFQELGKILSLNSQSESVASTFWVSCDPFPIGLWVEQNEPQDVCFRAFFWLFYENCYFCLCCYLVGLIHGWK